MAGSLVLERRHNSKNRKELKSTVFDGLVWSSNNVYFKFPANNALIFGLIKMVTGQNILQFFRREIFKHVGFFHKEII